MTTIIRGSATSANTPAISGLDGDTGVYFPAANTVAISTNGEERLRVDANGNVGIGTDSPFGKLNVVGGPLTTGSWHAGVTIRPSGNGNYASLVFDAQSRGSPDQYSAILWTTDASTSTSNKMVGEIYIFDSGSANYRVNLSPNIGVSSPIIVQSIYGNGSFERVIPGGSTLYPDFCARAWVNFNGTGTVAIRASGNVSSITDDGVGTYVVNFSAAMPDTAYALAGNSAVAVNTTNPKHLDVYSKTTTTVKVDNIENGVATDTYDIDVAIFR
jgi:hypothetical protein